jgi:nanoRNase/pAp phosphatase (c-di-AMP/oligoRNAs hydrolase)
MDDVKAKQQIVEKIKASASILVTVSNDPSVDALSAALGLTLLLDKLEKHPTAIFSGAVPPAITFLEPEKTFDSTTDSLRDFIIALDKEKADHLRYKVEGDSVKIFITPYKTTITSDDLEFSQGDFNVELVIALGVDNQDHLDGALASHGQILHDATIITVTAGDQTSSLGGIDWHDAQASSLSEMIAGLAEAMKTDKTKSLLDASIATSFLTGIVAATDRFSNPHTTSRVMTTAAQLMAAGADQQLIAMKLEESHEIGESSSTTVKTEEPAPVKDSLSISHEPTETLEEMDKRVKAAEQAEAATAAGDALAAKSNEDTKASDVSNAYAPEPADVAGEPSMGGTLNATTEQAAEDARHEKENDQNKTILSHSYLSSAPAYETPMSGSGSSGSGIGLLGHDDAPGQSSVNDTPPAADEPVHSAYSMDENMASTAPSSALPPMASITPPTPPAPADLGLPMPPPVPDFSQTTPMSAYAPDIATPPERLGDILAPEPPSVPPAPSAPVAPPPAPGPTDPTQFKIPGQP